MLSTDQMKVINSVKAMNGPVSLQELEDFSNQRKTVRDFTDGQISELAVIANATYRAGCPIFSDDLYDGIIIKRLEEIDPESPILHTVEAEELDLATDLIRHPVPMLSTNKVYSQEELEYEFIRVIKDACEEMGMPLSDIKLRMTAKLDGLAGRDDGNYLVTRGDGQKGSDVSRNFDRGLQVIGFKSDDSRGQGVGELVVLKSYFDTELKDHFPHPRNFMTGLIKADTLNEHAEKALQNGAAVFMPYVGLPAWEGSVDELLENYENIVEMVRNSVDSYIDGTVLQVENEEVRNLVGSTKRYNRWQVAIKQDTETGITPALSVTPQTGRTGQVTPVVELKPIYLSGGNLARVTAHHYGMIRDLQIGTGAELEIVRSGEVIPKIVSVVKPGKVEIPTECPSCGSTLEWEKDFLYCRNTSGCSAQLNTRLSHWFGIMGNVDGFGPATIEKLTDNGITKISEIFALDTQTLISYGFGQGEAKKLLKEVDRCKKQEVEDWRFLAAFGVRHLGRGSSEKLLENVKLLDIFNVTVEKLESIDGFGKGTSRTIIAGLGAIKDEVLGLHGLGFTLAETKAFDPTTSTSPFVGKNVIFTGSMQSGSRDDMKKNAKAMGAKVQGSVNGKTDYLICGDKVGPAKIEKAEKLGVKVLTENEYLEMIA